MNRIRLLVKSLAGTIVFLAILFVSAGRINYWQGWLYASISSILVVLNSFAPGVSDALAEERTATKTGTKSVAVLEGYREYAQKTRYRLVPYGW